MSGTSLHPGDPPHRRTPALPAASKTTPSAPSQAADALESQEAESVPLRLPRPSPGPAPSSPPVPARAAAAADGPQPGVPDRARQDGWVRRLRDRDEEALREVIAAFGERLAAVVQGILRDRDAVEDVVQATFTKAWFRIDSFHGDSGLYTWLYRVAVNACKDHAKSRRRRPAVPLDDEEMRCHAADVPHVLEGIERRERREQVRKAIAGLPARYRTVLALREIEGLSYDEIAAVLSLSMGTVESRLFRARRRLRDLLLGGPGGGGAGGRKEGRP